MGIIDKTSPDKTTTQLRLLSKPEVLDRIGVTYVTLWSWMQQGKFPRSRQLGGKSAWLETEIEDWISSLPTRRLKGDRKSA
jgi:predicted DNA-binding transcriptional regulator AlpA